MECTNYPPIILLKLHLKSVLKFCKHPRVRETVAYALSLIPWRWSDGSQVYQRETELQSFKSWTARFVVTLPKVGVQASEVRGSDELSHLHPKAGTAQLDNHACIAKLNDQRTMEFKRLDWMSPPSKVNRDDSPRQSEPKVQFSSCGLLILLNSISAVLDNLWKLWFRHDIQSS